MRFCSVGTGSGTEIIVEKMLFTNHVRPWMGDNCSNDAVHQSRSTTDGRDSLKGAILSLWCQNPEIMDPEEAEAREQQLIEEAFVYHTEKQYPAGVTDNRKRVIRKKAAKFEVQDGVLFYKMKKKDEVGVCDESSFKSVF